ncbi:cobalt-precorrin-5B (C(1))-methyltransferase [Thalassorhabdomicrobium marinisediminis]|uniref:cobalt-precorrin-5B (C(1))-methyltransferase n=1 Tax=Thalassorhabdomicrobium marinisediminis TaxID=2170577 RepID=UPI002491F0A6|nr:cobalt-precorrin-5B (C(1))-methyltransferase [Thalassorhabdomicrobium marinisediminis]
MTRVPIGELRRGWTTGACATAATKAALMALWGAAPARVSITLPKGEQPTFEVVGARQGAGWAEAGIVKDAGDDPDVTHGVTVIARVRRSSGGVVFKAGDGVGTVTRAGLPIDVGEPAINPVPRAMMDEVVAEMAAACAQAPDIEITISVPGGAEIAQKTWNPRLGIEGGLSILGTTGIVRPFSCAAWIASIHRGIDVARADGLTHVAGCTGNTSEKVVQALYGLPDHAMLDMGDFAGGMVKYLRRHPVRHVTIGGGIGKLTKLAQGAVDLHSGRSQVDFAALADWLGDERLATANTALEAYEMAGPALAEQVAQRAAARAMEMFAGGHLPQKLDIVVIDRAGAILARAERSAP